MPERIYRLVVKEFIHFFRQKRTVFFLIVPPVVQLLLFGYVATTDVNHVSTAFYDLDQTYESRELARQFVASQYFDVVYRPGSPGEVTDLLDRGKVLCAIQVNPHFGKDLQRGHPAEIQVIVDGTDSNTAMIALGYINGILGRFGRAYLPPSLSAASTSFDIRTRIWYNPSLRSRNYYVPGVIATIVLLTCLILTSMSVVREREIGTMEQLMVTPIRPIELMLGKTIPVAAVGYFDMMLVTVVGTLWFGAPIKGSIALLFLCTGVYLLSVLGIGLFISTVSKTQQQALMATFLFFMPAILLSGFAFPIESMPPFFQYITYLSPLRYFLIIVRGIFLKGVGIQALWPEVAALLLLGTVILGLSALRFRKRLA
jgi:ABC-2 type transport system permease protein